MTAKPRSLCARLEVVLFCISGADRSKGGGLGEGKVFGTVALEKHAILIDGSPWRSMEIHGFSLIFVVVP